MSTSPRTREVSESEAKVRDRRQLIVARSLAPTLAFVDPATRFRRALAHCGPSSPSLEYLVRLADRVPTDGHVRYRNTDPQTRQTSLHLAAAKGRLDLVRWLLDEGVDQAEVSRDVLGDTVLHVAAAHGHVAVLEAYLDRLPFVLGWVNSRGMTPLHVAAMKGELDAAQLLVDAGGDVDAPDLEGNSPLHFAASWGHVPIIKLLLDRGCDPDMRNADGFSPAEFAYSFGVLKDLETLIRQRAEQAKADDRAARRTKSRANSQTLRAKRTGTHSMLSIALPPMPSPGAHDVADDDGERSASSSFVASPDPTSFGLGLTQLAHPSGVPRLGAPIPPTPQAGASAFRRSTAPLATPDTPSEPHTPSSLYPNTTSPQPSPLPSPASRPSTPKLSPIMFRRFSSRASRASSTSVGSPATSAAHVSSPGGGGASASVVAPSPASGYSSAQQEQHATPESVQTATPTPASPTPASASGWSRRPTGSLSPAVYQSTQPGAYAASPVVAHYAPLSPAPPPAHGPSSPSPAPPPPPHPPLPLEHLPPLSAPESPGSPHSPPPHSAHSPSPAHNKLVRKSRSHAHAPSLSSAAHAHAHAHAQPDGAPPLGLLVPPGAQPGQRSASGPALGRSSAEWASGTGTGTGSSGRSSFDVAEAVVHDLREREREREREKERARGGHKLRKEHHHQHRASEASGTGTDRDKPQGGRLARVLGLRK